MDLNVKITLSDRLFELLEDKLPTLGRRVEKVLTKEIGAQVRGESTIEVQVSPTVATAESPEHAESPEAPKEPATSPAVKKLLSEADAREAVRAIIDRTRRRFCGEDYLTNRETEAYKKYYSKLTKVIKMIAVSLGAEKPSQLPPERVEAFGAECDALILDADDNIIAPAAPY